MYHWTFTLHSAGPEPGELWRKESQKASCSLSYNCDICIHFTYTYFVTIAYIDSIIILWVLNISINIKHFNSIYMFWSFFSLLAQLYVCHTNCIHCLYVWQIRLLSPWILGVKLAATCCRYQNRNAYLQLENSWYSLFVISGQFTDEPLDSVITSEVQLSCQQTHFLNWNCNN